MQRPFLKISFLLGIGTKTLIGAWAASFYTFKNTHSSFCRVKPPWTLDVYQIHIDLHIVDGPLLCFWFFLFLRLFFSLVHSSPLCGQTSGYIFLCCRGFGCWPCRPGCSALSLFTSLLSSSVSCDWFDGLLLFFSSMRGGLGFAFGFVVSHVSILCLNIRSSDCQVLPFGSVTRIRLL